MTIDWGGGYSARFKVFRVNEGTWADAYEVKGFTSISIDRDGTDDFPLLETGALTLDLSPEEEGIPSGYYRIAMLASQDGVHEERYDLATLLLEGNSGSLVHGVMETEIDGMSVLQPAKDRKISIGDYAPMGCDGAQYAAGLLKQCLTAPVYVNGSFTLDDYIVFDTGWTYLKAAWTVLDAAGWCIRISGNGAVTIMEKPTVPSLTLDSVSGNHILTPDMSRKLDLSRIPNVYTAVSDTNVETAVNDDEDSPTSIIQRGREIDEVDTSPARVNGETLWQYARRRLVEMSTVFKTYNCVREYQPDILPFDLIRASLPDLGFTGDMRVLSQSLKCDHGVQVSETLGLEIQEYSG